MSERKSWRSSRERHFRERLAASWQTCQRLFLLAGATPAAPVLRELATPFATVWCCCGSAAPPRKLRLRPLAPVAPLAPAIFLLGGGRRFSSPIKYFDYFFASSTRAMRPTVAGYQIVFRDGLLIFFLFSHSAIRAFDHPLDLRSKIFLITICWRT